MSSRPPHPPDSTDPADPSPTPAGRGWAVAAPVVAVAAGLLFAATAASSHGTDLRASRSDDLADAVRAAQTTVAALEQQITATRRQVDAATARAAVGDASVAAVTSVAAGRSAAAGLVAVSGPGLTVTLDDSPDPSLAGTGGVGADDLVVHQQDVQAVMNALWAGGAEAMTVMGRRVVATSAVRCVGNTLLLQGQVWSPPYRVAAIGNEDRMRAALDREPAVAIYREYVAAYGLGYRVTRVDRLSAPAYRGPLDLRYARVPAGSR